MAGTRKLHSTLGHSYPVRVARTAGAVAYPTQQKVLQGFSLETLEVQKLERELVDPCSAIFNRNQREKPR